MRAYTAETFIRKTITVETDDEREVERLAAEEIRQKLGDCVVVVTGFDLTAKQNHALLHD